MQTKVSRKSILTKTLACVLTKLLCSCSALYLVCGSTWGASVSYDFNTYPTFLLSPGLGTLWDGTCTNRCGSLFWDQSGGAGPIGGTSNGPVLGVAGDGFLGAAFASWGCDGNLSSFLCGAYLFDLGGPFDGGRLHAGYTFECDLRIGNGDPAPVGGLSINFMRTNDPVALAVSAGDTFLEMNGQVSPNGGRFSDYGNGSDLSLMEQGTTTGVSVSLQMSDNGPYRIPPDPGAVGLEAPGFVHNGIGLYVRLDGIVIAAVPMQNGTTQQTSDSRGNALIATDPEGTNAANDFKAVETGPYNGSGCNTNLYWVHFKVVLSTNGMLNVWWKNYQVITNLPTSLASYVSRFLLAARVGSRTANIDLDNAAITTIVAPEYTSPPSISLAQTNGQLVISYTGTLQYSLTPTGGYRDWSGASNPFMAPLAALNLTSGGQIFFRSRW